MAGNGCRFSERQARVMAEYVAELTKNNVQYIIHEHIDGWTVQVTGY